MKSIEIYAYHRIFYMINKSCTGFLTQKEMVVCFYDNEMMDITSDELDAIYGELDKDDSGSIKFEAFMKSVVEIEKLTENQVLLEAFTAMDYKK